jgi:hypothetical protein
MVAKIKATHAADVPGREAGDSREFLNYTRLLIERTELKLRDVIALDKTQ